MFVSLVLATGAALAPPPLAKLAIDRGITPGDLTALSWIVVAFLGTALLYWGATYVQTYLVGWIGQRALQDLRIQLFGHLQTMSVGFYSRKRAGVLISRLSNDVEALDTLVSDGIVTLFGSSLTLIGTAAILFALDAELAMLTYIVFPILGVASFGFRIVSADAYKATREKVASITAYLQETLSGIRVVRSFAQEPRHLKQFAALNEENREANMKTVYLNAAYFPGVELLSGRRDRRDPLLRRHPGRRGRDHDRRPGRLPGRAEQLLRPDPAALPALHDLPVGDGGAGQDLRAARRGARPRRRSDDAIDLPRIRGEIVLDGVTFAYGDGAPALDDVTLRVPPGQTVALVGTTGAGKSTLAKLVARFYDPTAGQRAGRRPRPARGHRPLAALADGDRAPGGVPVQRHDRREHRLRPPGRLDRRGPRGRPRRRRRRVHRAARARLRHRRSASAASSSPPASASSSPSPARWSPTPASWSSTRPPPTSTSTPSRGSRPACGACWPAAPRSSSPTASRRSSAPARSSCSSTAGSSSRAPTRSCSLWAATTGACTRTGASRPPRRFRGMEWQRCSSSAISAYRYRERRSRARLRRRAGWSTTIRAARCSSRSSSSRRPRALRQRRAQAASGSLRAGRQRRDRSAPDVVRALVDVLVGEAQDSVAGGPEDPVAGRVVAFHPWPLVMRPVDLDDEAVLGPLEVDLEAEELRVDERVRCRASARGRPSRPCSCSPAPPLAWIARASSRTWRFWRPLARCHGVTDRRARRDGLGTRPRGCTRRVPARVFSSARSTNMRSIVVTGMPL